MRYGEQTIEQVREAVDLVGLIGTQVSLKKAGRTWKGLCPFHPEKTPSFTVNPDRQAYHCFGCGAGGDAFRFLMETEKVSFVEALQVLAERYGVALPKAREEDLAGRLYGSLEDAAAFYRRNLEDPETGRTARAYLAGRGLEPPMLEAFGVGYAPPGWDGLSSRLLARHGQAALLEAGLVVRREKGGEGVYDRFRNRIVVPLRLPSGRVVGFGGRALGDEEPKYLNSPETPVYRKSRFLFGLDHARAALKASDHAVLVEGYFDVVALAQAGVEEAVAPAGTALTAEQCALLVRYVPKVLLVFDGDAAGSAAAEKALAPVVASGLDARVASLPAGEDPDTLVRRADGKEAWRSVVAAAVSPVEFLVRRRAGDREQALRACARLAALADDPIRVRLLVEEAARRLSFDEAALGREVDRQKAGGRAGASRSPLSAGRPAAQEGGNGRAGAADARGREAGGRRARGALVDSARALEAGFLEILVAHPDLVDEAAAHVDPSWFRSEEGRALAEFLIGPARRGAQALLSDPELTDPVRDLLSALLATARALPEPERALRDGMARLRQRALEDERALIQVRMRKALGDPGAREDLVVLQQRMQETAAALRALASEARRKERA